MYKARGATTTRRQRLTPGSNLCECPVCGEEFRSPEGFELHRRGTIDARRCLTPREMVARGLRRNAEGWWVTR